MAHRFTGRERLGVTLNRIAQSTQAEVQRELLRGAQRIQNTAVAGIINPPKTGRVYVRRGKRHQASAPGEFPAADTGRLHQSIISAVHVSPHSMQIQVSPNVKYADFLEYGTSRMAPRPFMAPAWAQNIDLIRANVKAAVRRGARGTGFRGFLNFILGR